MKKTIGTIAAVAFVAGTLIAIPQASAAPAAPKPNVPVASSTTPTAQAAATTNYWTAARMASAKPADKLVTPQKATVVPESQPTPVDAPTSVAPSLPKAVVPALTPKATYATGAVPRPYTNYPDRLNGKVFFTSGGLNYVCSGTIVNSSNKDMVDTAGHCVSNGHGVFHSNWAFVPAYSSSTRGQRPYGIWPSRYLTTMSDWHNYSNFKQDYGYANVQVVSGRHIVNYLGGQGTTWNQFLPTMYEYGYPQAAPYNGYDQRLTISAINGLDDPYPARYGPLAIRINSTQTGGTSGGGWLTFLSANGLGYVGGHSSYRYTNNPNTLYSPYYGNDEKLLYNFTRVR